jgi:hypothetical protein
MAGVAPWNYGNYYLGNTTMQMMPFMMNRVHQYGLMQATANLGGMGQMPSMPWTPYCLPSSFSMPMAASMMAAATPLPVAFNPLIQGMYPMASMSPVNWMEPSSFMSALTAGPMPYRPPAFEFPSNVGMVMTVPYGTPNPMLLSPAQGGFNSLSYFGSPSWYSHNYSTPQFSAPAPPMLSYYPPAIGPPPSYPIQYSPPIAAPHAQPMPVHQPRPLHSLPAVPSAHLPLPVGVDSPLIFPLEAANQNVFSQPPAMQSLQTTTFPSSHPALPIYSSASSLGPSIGQRLASNASYVPFSQQRNYEGTHSVAKYSSIRSSQTHGSLSDRIRRSRISLPRLSRSDYNLVKSLPRSEPVLPPITVGTLISDSGWLLKDDADQTISTASSRSDNKNRPVYTIGKDDASLHSYGSRVSFFPHRRRGHRQSNSSASEYDCAICAQQRDKRRIRKYFGSAALESFLTSSKKSRHRRGHRHRPQPASNETISSSHSAPTSAQKYDRRAKKRIKSPPSIDRSSPVLLRRSTIPEHTSHETLDRIAEKKDEESVAQRLEDNKKVEDDDDDDDDEDDEDDDSEVKSDNYGVRGSLISIETLDE